MYRTVASLKLGRAMTIGANARAAGYTLTSAEVQTLGRTINSLVAKRWVIPNQDPSARRQSESKPMPTYLNPSVLRSLLP